MSLTIQIVIKNNESTIKTCLDSLSSIRSEIKVIDIGSTDNSVSICEDYGLNCIKCSLNNNFSKLRNDNLGENDWFMWIKPWEKLISGHDEINLISSQKDFKKCFDFKVINQQIIFREQRLWNCNLNIKFKNFIFENPNFNNSIPADGVVLTQLKHNENFSESINIIDHWKSQNPLSPEPYYYEAYLMLSSGKYNEFCNLANYYLFNNKGGKSDLILRYNLANVQIYNQNMINEGIKNILKCLCENPIMAEFWCLLGDAYYKIKNYDKAISFYENAIIIGEKRELDFLPIEINKYKDHPKKMIESCKAILKDTKLFLEMNK